MKNKQNTFKVVILHENTNPNLVRIPLLLNARPAVDVHFNLAVIVHSILFSYSF